MYTLQYIKIYIPVYEDCLGTHTKYTNFVYAYIYKDYICIENKIHVYKVYIHTYLKNQKKGKEKNGKNWKKNRKRQKEKTEGNGKKKGKETDSHRPPPFPSLHGGRGTQTPTK